MLLVILATLFTVVASSGNGNLRLMEDEIAEALKTCQNKEKNSPMRTRRDSNYPRIDGNSVLDTDYMHAKRNAETRISVLNETGSTPVNSWAIPGSVSGWGGAGAPSGVARQRNRREEDLRRLDDECLSQCVFAHMQVVDVRGIPREAEMWSKIQAAVTSQQSRSALRDQLRACFQELQSEAEDDGCSYSNKLERCLILRLTDRLEAMENKTQRKQN